MAGYGAGVHLHLQPLQSGELRTTLRLSSHTPNPTTQTASKLSNLQNIVAGQPGAQSGAGGAAGLPPSSSTAALLHLWLKA